MRIFFFLLGAVAVWGLTACHGHSSEKEEEKKEILITEIPLDLKVPTGIWNLFGGEKKEEKKEEKKAEEKKSESGSGENTDAFVFSEIKVHLTEKNPDIVKNGEVVIAFPRGGGEIDLANYLSGRQGSFYVNFEFPEFTDATMKKILFVSHSRKRKIDDQIFGSGCHEFYDVSNRFLKEMTKEGLKVNTTRNRHTSVLGGTFVFAAKKAGQSYLTQVTFTDSQNKNLLCQEN